MMARHGVLLDDASMVQCARCGTENKSAAKFCVSCGSALAATGETLRIATLEEPPVSVPDWVFPSRLTEQPVERPRPSGWRAVKFLALTLAFFGVFLALPGYTIWATSSALREVGIMEYFKELPTCEESARAAGQDSSVCADPDVRTRFDLGTEQVKSERNRVLAFAGTAYAALAMGTLLLAMAAGLRPWWALGVLVSPLNLIVWFWALWRASALPLRPWERRR